jgi:dihydrofolate reductase
LDRALDFAKAENSGKAFIIGGGQIYKLFLAYATSLEMTEVYDTPIADTFFPNFSGAQFNEISRECNTGNTPKFDYVTYKRV